MKVALTFLLILVCVSTCKPEIPVPPDNFCCIQTYRNCFTLFDCGTRDTHVEACFRYCDRRYKTCKAMTSECRFPKALDLEPLDTKTFLQYATSVGWREKQM